MARDGTRTRHRLIEAGERLFAERGIDHVRMQEINAAAQAGNDSAVNYHFGSREGLVHAIFEVHHLQIGAVVDGLVAARGPDDPWTLREAIGLLAEALAGQLTTPSGRAYLQMLGEIYARGIEFPTSSTEGSDTDGSDPDGSDKDASGAATIAGVQDSVLALLAEIHSQLAFLPASIQVERLTRLSDFMVGAMASRARQLDRSISPNVAHEVFVADLVEMVVAAVTAPPAVGAT